MPEFEDLTMIELLDNFIEDINKIQETRSAKLFKTANADLQKIYNHHLANDKAFRRVQHNLKNLYTSFNYAAVIVNDALKKRVMDKDNAELLDECLEVMLRCCIVIEETLKKKKK
ncbi:MAG: hypothetical protein K2N23_02895 [Clostridia bacterium]|nr:hypothetical protein [Clostridia bacterium]